MGGEENRGGRSHGEELRCGRSQLPSANLESLAQLTHYLTMRLRLVVVVVVVVVEGGGGDKICNGNIGTKKIYTVEPPNKGHYGAKILSLVERLSLSRRYNNTLKY